MALPSPPPATCHGCGAPDGGPHQVDGCDMERCPFCRGQLVGCDCRYELLGLLDERHGPETGFLPRDTYENGLTAAEDARWTTILEAKGRIPFRETRLGPWTEPGVSPAEALVALTSAMVAQAVVQAETRGVAVPPMPLVVVPHLGELSVRVMAGWRDHDGTTAPPNTQLLVLPKRAMAARRARVAARRAIAIAIDTTALLRTADVVAEQLCEGVDPVVWPTVAVIERVTKRARGVFAKRTITRASFDGALIHAIHALPVGTSRG